MFVEELTQNKEYEANNLMSQFKSGARSQLWRTNKNGIYERPCETSQQSLQGIIFSLTQGLCEGQYDESNV